eukprot:scaffold254_cov71-Phaeocystis_antarctica.AAC.3
MAGRGAMPGPKMPTVLPSLLESSIKIVSGHSSCSLNRSSAYEISLLTSVLLRSLNQSDV